MGLPPIGQPPDKNCGDYFHVSKAAVRIKVGSVLGFGLVLRLGLSQGYTTGYSILQL